MPDTKVYWHNVKSRTAEIMGVAVRMEDGALIGKEGGREMSQSQFKAALASAAVIVGYSLKTPDGGKEGRLIAMHPTEMAKALLSQRFRLATDQEIEKYEKDFEVAQKRAREDARRSQIKLAVTQQRVEIEEDAEPSARAKK